MNWSQKELKKAFKDMILLGSDVPPSKAKRLQEESGTGRKLGVLSKNLYGVQFSGFAQWWSRFQVCPIFPPPSSHISTHAA